MKTLTLSSGLASHVAALPSTSKTFLLGTLKGGAGMAVAACHATPGSLRDATAMLPMGTVVLAATNAVGDRSYPVVHFESAGTCHADGVTVNVVADGTLDIDRFRVFTAASFVESNGARLAVPVVLVETDVCRVCDATGDLTSPEMTLNAAAPHLSITARVVCPVDISDVSDITTAMDLVFRFGADMGNKIPNLEFRIFTVSFVVAVPITVPVASSHAANQAIRRRVHEVFTLPMRPMLREREVVAPAANKFKGLTNPHLSVVNKIPVPGGTPFLVQGSYDYYHYKCDGFDDSGWGCAYRACQSVMSWYGHLGFVSTIPTLRDMQVILKEVDPDKQKKANFVGSRDWIGSFEVMMVLQKFLPSVECALQHVEKGSDFGENPTVMRVLQAHFKTVGSPVMIGGHNYAHTILGIDYNPSLGKIQYLILDPHYTAAVSDLTVALEKGFCGWKPPSFFNATHFYNMCLPKLPTDI